MRENEPVLLVLSVCDGKIILEKDEILYEKCHKRRATPPPGDHKGPPHPSTPPSPLRDHGFRFLIDAYWVTLAFTWYAYIFLPSNSGSYWKISSIGNWKMRAILNVSGRLGSYFPVSSAFTVWRETLRRSASSACDQLRSARRTFSLFCIALSVRSSISPCSDTLTDTPQRNHEWENPIPTNNWKAHRRKQAITERHD